MKEKLKFTFSIILRGLLVVSIPVLIIFHCFALIGYGDIYETTRPDDYGKIVGNIQNDEPRAFVESFFPAEIEDSFSEIVYHYKAKKLDGYAYECYLEFVIDNPDAYEDFIDQYVQKDLCIPFVYDSTFQEQVISNVLRLTENEQQAIYQIENAQLGKILFSDEQQRVIFVAIGMYDGGGTNTVELGHFFSRFQIDPWEYAKTAYATGYYQEKGITNEEMR